VIQSEAARSENAQLKKLLDYLEGPRFPQDYRAVTARVIARAPSQFEQQVVVAAGKNQGVAKHDVVVNGDGLVGEVTQVASNVARVTLLTDETSAVSALDVRTGASGIAQHGQSESSLDLDRVTKDQVVHVGDTIVTSGFRSGALTSLYPRGIPIGVVTSAGQSDTDVYKQVQVRPFVDFVDLEAVIVLVKKPGAK
jgi:rod shape-determining protein MreC